MAKVLVLSEKDLEKVLTITDAISGVESAYLQKAAEKACLFPMVFHEFVPGEADMDIKSGHLSESGIYGLKLVSWFGNNKEKQLPQLYGTTVLFDDSTGEPKALLNAGGITGMRTGAAGAIGAKYLARKDADTLMMVGTGEQAPYQIAATLAVLPNVKNVWLFDPLGEEIARRRVEAVSEEVNALLKGANLNREYVLKPVVDPAMAAKESQIIITVTPAREPVLCADWISPGTHLSCVGADMSGKQEVEGALLKRARVFADDIRQSVNVGECEMAIKQGFFSETAYAGELGQVIAGTLPGRQSDEEITVFDSTGIALQDLIVSGNAVTRARDLGIGVEVEL